MVSVGGKGVNISLVVLTNLVTAECFCLCLVAYRLQWRRRMMGPPRKWSMNWKKKLPTSSIHWLNRSRILCPIFTARRYVKRIVCYRSHWPTFSVCSQGSLVGLHMHDHKFLCAAVMICSTLVNIQTHTHRQTDTQTDKHTFWPVYMKSSASWAKYSKHPKGRMRWSPDCWVCGFLWMNVNGAVYNTAVCIIDKIIILLK